jgi:anti-anti-sigma factor
MDINFSYERGRVPITVLHIQGEVNLDSSRALEAAAQKAYDAGTRYMLLDLAGVPYMSSGGLRAIHSIFQLLSDGSSGDGGGPEEGSISAGTYASSYLKLLKPTRPVLQVLKMTGYDMFLEIYQDPKSALDSF